MERVDLSLFEKKIGIVFKNPDLLKQAFTHRSYLNEVSGRGVLHNERLEYLGDAVLELIVTEYLYEKFPQKPEGELTAYRASLVNTVSISQAAHDLGMNEFLLLSKGESKDIGRARQYILANTFESVIGALYLDQGYRATQSFVGKNLFGRLPSILEGRLWQDAKSRFQEKAQEIQGITPTYKVLEESGPDHDKHFVIGVFLGEETIGKGDGASKQEAEQNAAHTGLVAKGWQ